MLNCCSDSGFLVLVTHSPELILSRALLHLVHNRSLDVQKFGRLSQALVNYQKIMRTGVAHPRSDRSTKVPPNLVVHLEHNILPVGLMESDCTEVMIWVASSKGKGTESSSTSPIRCMEHEGRDILTLSTLAGGDHKEIKLNLIVMEPIRSPWILQDVGALFETPAVNG
ncbi:hypothetical protein A2U01_0000773 [Trifolium medium]|uniref:Uncharacterized protein n=1 Tax=Trifolium medium TaxID=97028 RepID=A0A392LYG5_9FABA|nr:hypothetical protein [Trifolium medium]